MTNPAPKHRVSVAEYEEMWESGRIAPDARVELIEGEISYMAPMGNRHAGTLVHLNRILQKAVGDHGLISCQGPIQLGDFSLPQPDFMVLRPHVDYYKSLRCTAEHVLLIIEISDSTLRRDRDVKMPLYASYGVQESWIFDLRKKLLHVFRSPVEGRYTQVSSTPSPGIVPLTQLPGVSVDLSDVLPRLLAV